MAGSRSRHRQGLRGPYRLRRKADWDRSRGNRVRFRWRRRRGRVEQRCRELQPDARARPSGLYGGADREDLERESTSCMERGGESRVRYSDRAQVNRDSAELSAQVLSTGQSATSSPASNGVFGGTTLASYRASTYTFWMVTV